MTTKEYSEHEAEAFAVAYPHVIGVLKEKAGDKFRSLIFELADVDERGGSATWYPKENDSETWYAEWTGDQVDVGSEIIEYND